MKIEATGALPSENVTVSTKWQFLFFASLNLICKAESPILYKYWVSKLDIISSCGVHRGGLKVTVMNKLESELVSDEMVFDLTLRSTSKVWSSSVHSLVFNLTLGCFMKLRLQVSFVS